MGFGRPVVRLLAAMLVVGHVAGRPALAEESYRPRIGITGTETVEQGHQRLQTYIRAVTAAGGEPVILPFGADVSGQLLDGVLFAGGEDVNPALYGERPHPTIDVNDLRDVSEMVQAEQALDQGLPVLGICRGSQLLNVRLGGSLIRDIPSQVDGHRAHGSGSMHPITLQRDSRLAKTIGLHRLTVNSYHHQAVKRLAPALRVVATSEDGIVEAWEARPDGPITSYLTGVQFHPEKPDFPKPEIRTRLFADFLDAARSFAAKRQAKATGKAPAVD